MPEAKLCEDCAGGAERCEREGHLLGEQATNEADLKLGVRVYLCRRCETLVYVPCCPRCGREHPRGPE